MTIRQFIEWFKYQVQNKSVADMTKAELTIVELIIDLYKEENK